MKRNIVIWILIILIIPSLSIASNWSKEDTYWEAACLSVITVDWMQTHHMAEKDFYVNGKQLREINPILGSQPTQKDVDLYFVSALAVHATAAFLLPKKWRRIFQGGTVGLELFIIGNNYRLGAGFNW